jgi:hypothetical protein
VQVDDEELCRPISPDQLWQLRDDARPQRVAWRWDERADYFRGGHDAYARLDPPVLVTREVLLVKGGPDVVIRDSIDGRGSHSLVWRFHLDPSLDAVVEPGGVRLTRADGEAWLQLAEPPPGFTMAIEDGWVSPTYGVRLASKVVAITARTALPVAVIWRIGRTEWTPTALRTLATLLPARAHDSLVTM